MPCLPLIPQYQSRLAIMATRHPHPRAHSVCTRPRRFSASTTRPCASVRAPAKSRAQRWAVPGCSWKTILLPICDPSMLVPGKRCE